MKKRVADLIMEVLIQNRITDCFAVVGGGAMHIDNALALRDDIRKVFCHHEQACAMAAEGYAKACGRMALVSVTSGPGAINTFNGVQGAWVDNTPMLIIAGFPRYDTAIEPTGLNLRCRGVQEFDAVSAVKGFTKYAKLIKDPLSIQCELQKAIDLAMSGRKGPVWLSIPLDVQGTIVETDELYPCEIVESAEQDISEEIIALVNQEIEKSLKPCILTGSAIRTSGSIDLFREWVKKLNIPIVGGALQPDICYEGFDNYYGMSGSIGPRKGNYILQNSDLIIVLGNSLSTKQTGFNQELFAPKARIVMIDIEEDEMKKPGIRVDIPIKADIKAFLESTMDRLNPWITNMEWKQYCDTLDKYIGEIDMPIYKEDSERVSYKSIALEGLGLLKRDAILALGNSNGMVAFLQNDVKTKEQKAIVNYNSGSMGDDITEAIGIAVATGKEVVCVTGDGSIMMNLQELQTIRHYNLPIKIIVMSNNGYGALRQTYKNFFDGTYIGCDSDSGVSFPNFEQVAKIFNFTYDCVDCIGELKRKLEIFFSSDTRMFLEVKQKFDDPVLPKIMSKMNKDGSFSTPGLDEMYPYIGG